MEQFKISLTLISFVCLSPYKYRPALLRGNASKLEKRKGLSRTCGSKINRKISNVKLGNFVQVSKWKPLMIILISCAYICSNSTSNSNYISLISSKMAMANDLSLVHYHFDYSYTKTTCTQQKSINDILKQRHIP